MVIANDSAKSFISTTSRATKTAIIALLCLLTALAGTGCSGMRAVELQQPLPDDIRQLALDLSNFHGNVIVESDGAPGGPAIINADIYADRSLPEERRQELAENVVIASELQAAGHGRAILRVTATSPEPQVQSHGANLHIVMPRVDGVRVQNQGGYVELVGVGGAIEVRNAGGSIEVRTDRNLDDPITLLTTDGDIWLQMAPEARGRLDIKTLTGKAVLRNKDQLALGDAWTSGRRLVATLNDGSNPIVARTDDGNVRVWVMENPEALTRTRKRDWPDIRDYMYLQTRRRYTRNLPDNHPEVTTPPTTRWIYRD